jgi:hypothetical protein
MTPTNDQDTPPSPQEARNYVWRTKDNGEITLGSASDTHLKNIEAHLIREISDAEDCRLDILEEAFQEGFTGQEDRIEMLETSLRHVRVERSCRMKESAT